MRLMGYYCQTQQYLFMSNPPWKKPDASKPANPPPSGNLPPWMKKPAQTPNPPPTGGFVPPSNPPASKPPPATGGGNAPWMKKAEQGQPPQSSQPPYKPPGGPPTSSNPASSGTQPWMKNKPPAFNPANKQNEEQQAKKREEQQKRQQEEKEKQLLQQQRELNLMKIEEEHSKIREKQDEENQIIHKKNKKKGKNIKSSPTKKMSSPNKLKKKAIGSTFFHKYIDFLGLSCSKAEEYEEKIEHQKNLLKSLSDFTESCKQKLGEYLSQRKIVARKKNCINLQNLFIEYALVEATTTEAKGQGPQKTLKTIYKTKQVEQMEKTFSLYQILFNIIIKLMKKTTIFRIRVPLLTWVSFKGLQFLCEGICDDLAEAASSVAQNYPEISGQLTQLQKQLNNLGYGFLNRKNFVVKKMMLEGEDIFVLYFSQNLHSMIFNENFSYNSNKFSPYQPLTIEKFTNFDSIFSQTLPIPYSEIQKLKEIKKSSTTKMNQYLSIFEVAHAVRLVYSSCQGEVDEQSFWDLVFDGRTEVWDLIQKCYQSYFSIPFPHFDLNRKNFLADILQLMVPIKFGIKKFKVESSPSTSRVQKKKLTMTGHRPIAFMYPLDNLELIEIVNLFRRNLEKSNKIALAEQSIDIQKNIREISGDKILGQLEFLKNNVQLHLKNWELNKNFGGEKGDKSALAYAECLKILQEYSFKKGKERQKMVIYPLLLTVYMMNEHPKAVKKPENSEMEEEMLEEGEKEEKEISQEKTNSSENNETKMLKILSRLLESLSQYLGSEEQSWFHATIYLLVSEYYSRKRSTSSPLQFKNDAEGFSKSQANSGGQQNSLNASEIQKVTNLEDSMQASREYQSLVNSIQNEPHPHYEECLKFLEHAHSIFLQFYGTYSFELADMLAQKSVVLLNVGDYIKAGEVIEEALKIYKSSSKHASIICQSQFVLGKCIIEQGKKQKNERKLDEGRRLIQKTGKQFQTLGMHFEAIQAYEYLYASVQPRSRFVQKQAVGDGNLSEQYMEKMCEVALACNHPSTLKSVVQKVIQSEASIYSKQKMKIIQEIRDEREEDFDDQSQIDRVFLALEEESKTFGGFIEMAKWSLRVLEFKADSSEWERAAEIMRNLLCLFDKEEMSVIF